MSEARFIEISNAFFVNDRYRAVLEGLGLRSFEDVFAFEDGENLTKSNLARHRSRLRVKAGSPAMTLYLKRYDNPPKSVQVKNWLSHRRLIDLARCEINPARELSAAGIGAPEVVAYGSQKGLFFEKRSFTVTRGIPDADAIERSLPSYFAAGPSCENLKLRRKFIDSLAGFVRKFHKTGYRHRDLYFSHIFYNETQGKFYLIDLARAFKPGLLGERFRVKDIAQLFYSAPGVNFSRTDRMRFYRRYRTISGRLTRTDKTFIRKVLIKAHRMACHDVKHGRTVPFLDKDATN